ncbi:MAG TPA: LamG domain-containing protein [Gammaproteobacteria bacterium]|nr:LamG domain-containing protein [Gammaproteobacteria bacterium]
MTNSVPGLSGNARTGIGRWLLEVLCLLVVATSLGACVRDETEPSPTGGTGNEIVDGNGAGDAADGDTTPDPVDPNQPEEPPQLADQVLFEQTLYPHLRDPNNQCVNCHESVQIPTIAAEDPTVAYNVLTTQQKVNIGNPVLSRVYQRVAIERHNCGGAEICDRIAADFLTAIQSWADQAMLPIPPSGTKLMSATTDFAAGRENASTRVADGQIALFEFLEGAGDVTLDTSGAATPLTLQVEGMEWVEGGLRNVSGGAQASVADSQRIFESISATGAYTLEAWVVAANNTQDGPASVISYSSAANVGNFMLGQNAIYYQLRNTTEASDASGAPALEAVTRRVEAVLQHVVVTFDEAAGRRVYVDGQLDIEDNTPATLAWTNDQQLVLGNDVTGERLWQGVFDLVAIYDRALSGAEIIQNYQAGAGTLTTLSFDVSDIVGGPTTIRLQAATLDDSSYLFATPVLYSDVTPVRVRNIRIAVNGNVPVAAQAFRRVEVTAQSNGTRISPLGAVIPIDLGPELDQFHLEFEVLGNQTGLAESIAPSNPPPLPREVAEPVVGMRTFSQVNNTMAALTGVDPANAAVNTRFGELRDALPPTFDILAFSSAQQIAIQQLAITYCGAVVTDAGSCSAMFGTCAIDAGGKEAVAASLYEKFLGQNLANQPDVAGFTTAIVGVIDDLGCAGGCTGATAATALQASCAAVLASGAVTIN